MGHTAQRQVSFAKSAQAARQADDEEYDVMSRFAKHASRCVQCNDPVEAYRSTGALCQSGNAYAREVAQYVYSKNGTAYSVVDRQQRREKIQIEVPANCAVIKKLCKAVDQGLSLRREKPTVVDDRSRRVEQPRPVERYNEYDTVTIKPSSEREEKRRHDGREKKTEKRKDVVYVKGRGSLYEKDEAERKQRSEAQPIILDIAPGRRYNR